MQTFSRNDRSNSKLICLVAHVTSVFEPEFDYLPYGMFNTYLPIAAVFTLGGRQRLVVTLRITMRS